MKIGFDFIETFSKLGLPDANRVLTLRAMFIFEFSRQNSASFRSNSIHPDHLLLAILQEDLGVGVHALRQAKLDTNFLRTSMIKYLWTQDRRRQGDAHISKEMEDIILTAHRVSLEIGDRYIGTEHLVIAYWIIYEKNLVNLFEKSAIPSLADVRASVAIIKSGPS